MPLSFSDHHMADIARISDRFIAAANEFELCHIYDQIIDELNEVLYVKLKRRESTWTGELTFPVHFTISDSTDASDYFRRIADAIYIHADNLGDLQYGLGRAQLGDVQPD